MTARHKKLYKSTRDRLGESVWWTVGGGVPVKVKAVFASPVEDFPLGDGTAFRTTAPVLKVQAEDLPDGAKKGDGVEIDESGATYTAGPMVPNGRGWIIIPLTEA